MRLATLDVVGRNDDVEAVAELEKPEHQHDLGAKRAGTDGGRDRVALRFELAEQLTHAGEDFYAFLGELSKYPFLALHELAYGAFVGIDRIVA